MDDSTSSSLINRLQDEDQIGWSRFVNLYAPVVYQWTRQAGLSEEDAADVGQEVFRTVAGRVAEFRRQNRGSFRSWLRTITRNKIGDHLKRNRAEDIAFGGSDSRIKNSATVEPLVDREEDETRDQQTLFGAALRLIQTDFHETTWQAFWRVTIEGQSVESVAQDLEMEPKAIRQAKYRVLKRLREEFGELLD